MAPNTSHLTLRSALDTGAADARKHGIDTATHQQAGTSIITTHYHVSQHIYMCLVLPFCTWRLSTMYKGSPVIHKGSMGRCWSPLLVDSPWVTLVGYARAHLRVAATILRRARGYLPSRTASPSFGCRVSYTLHIPTERRPSSVDLCEWLHTRMIYPPLDSHPSRY